MFVLLKKIQVGNDQEKAQSEKNSYNKVLREHIVSSYFQTGGHSILQRNRYKDYLYLSGLPCPLYFCLNQLDPYPIMFQRKLNSIVHFRLDVVVFFFFFFFFFFF